MWPRVLGRGSQSQRPLRSGERFTERIVTPWLNQPKLMLLVLILGRLFGLNALL